jgi:hypothetical protein
MSTGGEATSVVDEAGAAEVSHKLMQDVLQRMRHDGDTMAGYRGLMLFLLVRLRCVSVRIRPLEGLSAPSGLRLRL